MQLLTLKGYLHTATERATKGYFLDVANALTLHASSWIRTSDVLSKRDYESRAIVHSAIDASSMITDFVHFLYAYKKNRE
jgi:hypothetical protein